MPKFPTTRTPPNPSTQSGFTLLQVMLGIAVLSAGTILAQPTFERAQQAILRTATISNINEISQAAKAHFLDSVNDGIGNPTAPCPSLNYPDACWPVDIAELIADGYIGDNADQSGFGLEIEVTPNSRTVIVDAQAPTVAQANLVAIAFGGLATIDATDLNDIRIQVEYASPGIDAEDQALLDRTGERQMIGPIRFDMNTAIARALAAGTPPDMSNVAIDLAGLGDIIDAREFNSDTIGVGNSIDAPASGGGIAAEIGGPLGTVEINASGNLEAPSGIITVFTSDNLTVNQDAEITNDVDIGGTLRIAN